MQNSKPKQYRQTQKQERLLWGPGTELKYKAMSTTEATHMLAFEYRNKQ